MSCEHCVFFNIPPAFNFGCSLLADDCQWTRRRCFHAEMHELHDEVMLLDITHRSRLCALMCFLRIGPSLNTNIRIGPSRDLGKMPLLCSIPKERKLQAHLKREQQSAITMTNKQANGHQSLCKLKQQSLRHHLQLLRSECDQPEQDSRGIHQGEKDMQRSRLLA